jgi:hypothetical protein
MAITLKPTYKPEVLQGAPLQYAPENEAGVVYLFSQMAKKWGIKVERIQAAFPDCVATQKIGGRRKEIRIEFEYRSKNFLTHGQNPKKCDWIVCWEHNWSDVPKHLKIVELKNEFALGRNIWLMAFWSKDAEEAGTFGGRKKMPVPANARRGDLLLVYFTEPLSCLTRVFEIASAPQKTPSNSSWSAAKMATVKEVAVLKDPIYFQELKRHPFLKTASFVRRRLQTDQKLTEHWPWLLDAIVKKNRSLNSALKPYAPTLE